MHLDTDPCRDKPIRFVAQQDIKLLGERQSKTGESPKSKVFQRVIESAENSIDAQKQFWRNPIWPSDTKKIEILSVDWPDEE